MDGPDLLLSENCFLSGGFILKIDIDWICEYKLALSPNSAILGKYAGNILSILEFYHDLLGISKTSFPRLPRIPLMTHPRAKFRANLVWEICCECDCVDKAKST